MDATRPKFPAYDNNGLHLAALAAQHREEAALEELWKLPAALRCAHCGEVIAAGETWFGPIPMPGQSELAVPRYHADRTECRYAGGLPA